MTTRAEQLIQLAETKLVLSVPEHEAERELLRQVIKGEDANYTADDDTLNDPGNTSEWNETRTLRASLIVWLCTDIEARPFLTHRGLRIVGAKIEGALNLQFVSIDFPMVFRRCAFTKPIGLDWAKVKFLDLSGSYVASSQIYNLSEKLIISSLEANGIQVDSDVFLCNGFQATGRVSLMGATIGGNLHCKDGTFFGSEGTALLADNAAIEGNAFLCYGFQATGIVSLLRATIGGELNCNDGHFDYPEGKYALIVQGAQIKGSLLLRKSKVNGTVWLIRATIGANLECDDGQFYYGAEGDALQAENSEIKGSFLLRKSKVNGTVCLMGATIDGNLDCDAGVFESSKGLALFAEDAEIKSNILLRNAFVNGAIGLRGATIDGVLDCEGGTFHNPAGFALAAVSAEIKNVLLRNSYMNGAVWLTGATIDRDLDCRGGTFHNPGGFALHADSSEIYGHVILSDGFRAAGKVSFCDATIQDRISIRPRSLSFYQLPLKLAKFTLNLIILNALVGALFLQLHINYKLPLKFAKFVLKLVSLNPLAGILFWQHLYSLILNFQFATVRTLADSEESWPLHGNLKLNGFSYEKISLHSPIKSAQRLRWLRLQNQEIFFPQPYEQLAQVLQASGYEQAATEVLIGKQKDRRRYGGLNCINRFWNCCLGTTIAHGYRPHQALIFALGFVVSGTVLFSLGYSGSPKLISPSKIESFNATSPSPSGSVSDDYPKFNPFVYSLDVFIPIVDLHQQSYWLPNANRGIEIPLLLFKCKTGSLLRWYFWIHIVWGWILTSLWVAGFTGLVRRVE